jgi:hypothetical protein
MSTSTQTWFDLHVLNNDSFVFYVAINNNDNTFPVYKVFYGVLVKK